MKRNIANIIGKKLTDSLNSDDEKEFNKWIHSSEFNQDTYQKIETYWKHTPEQKGLDSTAELISRLKYRIHQPTLDISKYLYKWKLAASILLIISVGLSLVIAFSLERPMPSLTLQTEKGQRTSALLADGTRVWLNADSELKITDFSKDKRVVSLSGEAQFEVTKDADRPFIVETSHIDVQVLGTIFNVKAYDEDETVKATLVEGKLRVKGKEWRSKKVYILNPGQSLTFYKGSKEFLVDNVDVNEDVSWRDGVLIFKSMPFQKLTDLLERNYDVEIVYPKSTFNKIHYSGTLDNMTINQVMEVLSLSIPMTYEIKKNRVIINQ
nr:FecR domain-containing protein [uncultured Carboxylicivirga sp.]